MGFFTSNRNDADAGTCTRTLMLTLMLFLIQLHSQMCICRAQLLSPSDMAVGRWKLTLKRRDRSLLESMVFPLQQQTQHEDEHEREHSRSRSAGTSSPRRRKAKRRKRLDCDLILHQDGTFTLMPPASFLHDDGKHGHHHNHRDEIPIQSTTEISKVTQMEDRAVLEHSDNAHEKQTTPMLDPQSQASHRQHQPLRGIWKLDPNPYCVTDRQYDELTLKSIPKVRINSERMPMSDSTSNSKSAEPNERNDSKEKIIIEMNCNVWGRFGSNPIRHMLKRPRGKDAGRLTHGTMSIVKMKQSEPDSKPMHASDSRSLERSSPVRRVLFGTFQARSTSLSVPTSIPTFALVEAPSAVIPDATARVDEADEEEQRSATTSEPAPKSVKEIVAVNTNSPQNIGYGFI